MGIVLGVPDIAFALLMPRDILSVKVGCLKSSFTVVFIGSLRGIGDTRVRRDKEIRITQDVRWRTCIMLKKTKNDQKTHAVFNVSLAASF